MVEDRTHCSTHGPTVERQRLLTDIFDDIARRHADRVAIDVPPSSRREQRVTMSYAALQAASQALATHLVDHMAGDRNGQAAGVGNEAIVAIFLARDAPQLYIAQLAAMRAGAAFTCIEPSFPSEQIKMILDDARPVAIITDAGGLDRLRREGLATSSTIDIATCERPLSSISFRERSPRELAYVIYTSGTTGRPKGVMIEEESIANLVRSDIALFRLGVADRVAQCSSPAYDSSIEETWLAFGVGATLVPLDDETVRLGPDLVPWLRRERITVLCPPPTLLRTTGCEHPDRELPEVRLLYVGGEALPADLADRWGRGRWLENGYGPTECTVTVVRTRIEPGQTITIGRPIAGHRAWVLNEALEEVEDGEHGELCIAGVGLARGYRDRPELTDQRFPIHPFFGRIYRTGDLVRRNTDGDLEYLGRLDGQVKLRGYRVELQAIDAVLSQCPGVRDAACSVQGEGSEQVLVAHCVATDPASPPSVDTLKEAVRRSLPSYMVPARIGMIAMLPRTVGGKIDRKSLPSVHAPARDTATVIAARSALEATIVSAFARASRATHAISIDDDFFLDLGGDSLSAVAVLCELRAIPETSVTTVRDLYESRTANELAQRVTKRRAERQRGAVRDEHDRHDRHDRHDHHARHTRDRSRMGQPPIAGPAILVSLAQAACLLLCIATSGIASYLLAFVLGPWLVARTSLVTAILLVPLVATLLVVAYLPLAVAVTALLQRVLVGRSRPQSIRVWSIAYTRHWIVQQSARLIPWRFLEGTVFLGTVLRALGARVGRRVHIHRGVALRQGGWHLLTIGDDVTLSQESSVGLVELDDGHLTFGRITIGDGCTLEPRAGMGANTCMKPRSTLMALSWLEDGVTVPADERWDGVPARCVGKSATTPTSVRGRSLHPVLHGAIMLAARPLRSLALAIPLAIAVAVLAFFNLAPDSALNASAWLRSLPLGWILLASVALLPTALVLQAVGMRLCGRVAPGVLSRWSIGYLIVWAKTSAVDEAGRWLSGSLFWPHWLRLAGMRVGRGCEVSTIIDVLPETVTIGEESFFADGIYFCPPRVDRGTVTVAATTIGARTFLGNHAFVLAGEVWPDDLFIGVSTVADPQRVRPASGWFGHPAMELPRRDVVSVDPRLTHHPSALRYLNRLFWETLRFAIPVVPLLVVYGWASGIAWASELVSAPILVLAIVPMVTLLAYISLVAAIILLKWTLLGRVRPGQHPLWSSWCSRWDFLYVAWGFWARGMLEQLGGTPFLAWFLRAVGVTIGKNVVLGNGFAQIVDPDMLSIEDGATVTCNFQAHSFEDRILKIDRLRIRRGATVGHGAVVFYGADIGEHAHVLPHSVVMKNERLDADTAYAGCPTQAV